MFSHPRCYAAELKTCSTTISSEHAISAKMLELFVEGGGVDIGGLSWMADEERRSLPVKAFASNVLCTDHNSQLSPLDDCGGKFVHRLLDVRAQLRVHRRRRPIPEASFLGETLERWLLKCLCGLVASGNALSPAETPPRWGPPLSWLEVLFGYEPMPNRCGLYFIGQPGDSREIMPGFQFAVIGNQAVGPYGLTVGFVEKEFVLAMLGPEASMASLLSDAAYRPGTFVDQNGINSATTSLTWPEGHHGAEVVIQHDNPRAGPK